MKYVNVRITIKLPDGTTYVIVIRVCIPSGGDLQKTVSGMMDQIVAANVPEIKDKKYEVSSVVEVASSE